MDELTDIMSIINLESSEGRTKILYDSIKNSNDVLNIYDPSAVNISNMEYTCGLALERYRYYMKYLYVDEWDNRQIVNYIYEYCNTGNSNGNGNSITIQERYLLMQVIDLKIYKDIHLGTLKD
ncbi:hypothetical protein CCP3SC1AL1_4510001 [Gammaproteobacteria bacterium]